MIQEIDTTVFEVPVTVHYTFEKGDAGDRETSPMPDKCDIVKVMFKQTDITEFVSEAGYDDILIEECIVAENNYRDEPLED